MDYETIILEKKDHVARLTLNRPDRPECTEPADVRRGELGAGRRSRGPGNAGAGADWRGPGLLCLGRYQGGEAGGRPAAGLHGAQRDLPVHSHGATGHHPEAAPDGDTNHCDGQRPGHWRRVRLRAGVRHPGRLRTLPLHERLPADGAGIEHRGNLALPLERWE